MPAKIDINGARFGRLLIVRESSIRSGGRRQVDYLCDCGKTGLVDPRSVLNGDTRSCGCLQKEAVAAAASRRATHAHSRTPEYNIWVKMKMRCENPNDKKFALYGQRGITVCDQWQADFPQFLADMGVRPSPLHSIDRIDVNAAYHPANCRWALPKEQSRNKRYHRIVQHDGQSMPLSEACERAGVNYRSALYRLNAGRDWRPLPNPPASTGGEVAK